MGNGGDIGNIWFPDIEFVEEIVSRMVPVLFAKYEDGVPDFQYSWRFTGAWSFGVGASSTAANIFRGISLFVYTIHGSYADLVYY